ncbi:ribonuclease 3-like [Aristolochia californica]|uniref:ribonuclease 3-like n=1 Tax=Aristolochia californica TaxID=171875 RepID=UPI0035DA59B1
MARFCAFLGLVALLSCSVSMAQDNTYLNLKWPGGMCSGKNKCCFPCTMSNPNDFKIDYLARNFRSGAPSCNTDPFFVNTVQSYISDLYENWPGLRCPVETGVLAWGTAWDDNGVCSGLNQFNYFSKTLNLFKSSRLLQLLAAKGVIPSKHWNYTQSEVLNAINGGLGLRSSALIHCGSNSSGIIRTVRLCADITASRFIDCPNPLPSTCAQNVQLLPVVTSGTHEDEEAAARTTDNIKMVVN